MISYTYIVSFIFLFSFSFIKSFFLSRNNSRKIPIQFSGEASACVAHGEGLDRPRVGRQNSFLVDCSAGGSNVLFVGVYGPDTPCEEVHVR